jgi:hypothetical protein
MGSADLQVRVEPYKRVAARNLLTLQEITGRIR